MQFLLLGVHVQLHIFRFRLLLEKRDVLGVQSEAHVEHNKDVSELTLRRTLNAALIF